MHYDLHKQTVLSLANLMLEYITLADRQYYYNQTFYVDSTKMRLLIRPANLTEHFAFFRSVKVLN